MHFTYTTYYSVNKENDSGDILSLYFNRGVIKRRDPALTLPKFGYKHEKICTMKEFTIVVYDITELVTFNCFNI